MLTQGRQLFILARMYIGLDARKPVFGVCEQKRRSPTCASAHTDQRLCCSLFGKDNIYTCYERIFNFLASLCSLGDWFESCIVGNPEDTFCRASRSHYDSIQAQRHQTDSVPVRSELISSAGYNYAVLNHGQDYPLQNLMGQQ